MSVTLQPVLEAMGYRDGVQQRAIVKLLQISGAYGRLQGVDGVASDKQAQAILQHVTYDNPFQAADWLHNVTQQHMLRRPPGAERHDCEEPPHFKQHRVELLEALRQSGMLAEVTPAKKYYDHVLLHGAMESDVDNRLDTIKRLWESGVRFGRIHMLGSERPLNPNCEPSAGAKICTEMQMMHSRYCEKSAGWPAGLQDVRVFAVNTFNKPDGTRANTKDTAQSWIETRPAPGDVLAISTQPFVPYQDAAVASVLPPPFPLETVGSAAHEEVKISVALDAIARQIDVGLSKLSEKLQRKNPKLETKLAMLDPGSIQVDAPTYQFRSGGDKNGVTGKGRYACDRWDPILHGDPILVHERLDGRVFVADGHHRVDLAKRLNEKGAGPGKIAATVLREADGYTAQDVKIIAAYKNIAHGQTNPVDTARVFKEAQSGTVHQELLPNLQMDKGNLKMAFTLSKLSDRALDTVAKNDIPADVAAKVVERLPNEPVKQDEVIRIISEKLQQKYELSENAQPTTLNVHISSLAQDLKRLGGFVDKLSQQRAKPAQIGVSC